ncbi:TetR/AcrR family transcriptional regulator [Streptomyces cavourensis]|uniref:TetR/AcrR family transcriptional regulator n=1 Tax=Streptomyces cavourensis TaxID=67258 RepID=UPI0020C99ABB|nr:helix-turn-helix domain-containing protein [Streptomyces cavourensis]
MTAQGDTEPPKGRPKDPRVDAALLDAAIEVLNESGWAAFTTTAVARRAGASTASLYRRWPSKQALAGAVARHIALDERPPSTAAGPPSRPSPEPSPGTSPWTNWAASTPAPWRATSANCSPPSAASWRTPPAPPSSP